jgi:hypothetical protein
MKKLSIENKEAFRDFIKRDEGKRGYVISFKGEANTTLRSFFKGLFSFVFTRRITSFSSYNDKSIRIITNNYVDRINNGMIKKFEAECVKEFIYETKSEYDKENEKFWSQNTSKLVMSARILQRANCYLTALEGGYRNDDFINGSFKKYKNKDNSIKGALKGAFSGFFGGLFGILITGFVLWAILALIVFIVELFS